MGSELVDHTLIFSSIEIGRARLFRAATAQ